MKKYFKLVLMIASIASAETLFEVKDSSNNKVLDVSTDGLRVLNGSDTLMVISTDGIRAYIQKDVKGLSRSFSVTTASSKEGESKSQNKVFEVATDAGSTFYNPNNSTDKIFSISNGSITANVNPALNRDFVVNNTVAGKVDNNLMKVSYKDTFEAIDDSTMLYYKKKNAFRVGYVKIDADADVGQASFATGYKNLASGWFSSSMGAGTKAQAFASTAMGLQTIASGCNSTATGWLTTARSLNAFTCGSLNNDWGSSTIWNPADPQFIIGNGVIVSLNPNVYNYSNAFTVLKNGNISIGNIVPNSKLDVAGDVRINDNTLYLRGPNDLNHGLRFYDYWNSTSINGPVLFGYAGGALGTINGTLAMTWNNSGTATIPSGNLILSAGDAVISTLPSETLGIGTKKPVYVDQAGKLCVLSKEEKSSEDQIAEQSEEIEKLKQENLSIRLELNEIKRILNIKQGG